MKSVFLIKILLQILEPFHKPRKAPSFQINSNESRFILLKLDYFLLKASEIYTRMLSTIFCGPFRNRLSL